MNGMSSKDGQDRKSWQILANQANLFKETTRNSYQATWLVWIRAKRRELPYLAPGGNIMGCMCKKVLRILAGLALIGVSLKYIAVDPWLVVGSYLLLRGAMPFVCQCGCGCCTMEGKKKK